MHLTIDMDVMIEFCEDHRDLLCNIAIVLIMYFTAYQLDDYCLLRNIVQGKRGIAGDKSDISM